MKRVMKLEELATTRVMPITAFFPFALAGYVLFFFLSFSFLGGRGEGAEIEVGSREENGDGDPGEGA